MQTLQNAARGKGKSLFRMAEDIIDTEELKPAARRFDGLCARRHPWRCLVDTMTHTELAELVLDESGYTAMWQADKSPEHRANWKRKNLCVQWKNLRR